MSVSSDFEDIVKICEFYASSTDDIEVDSENYHVTMGGYGIDLVMVNDHLVTCLVEDREGVTRFVGELDYFFQSEFADSWEDRF